MARDHARFKVSIWHDPDFRALPVDAQHAYMAVTSQPGLSYAGVIDYIPGRIAALAKGHTAARVRRAVARLTTDRFLVVDEDTSELLVRTYVRHDGVMDRKNMGKATARSYGKVISLDLRAVILDELGRLYREDDQLHGWDGFREIDPDAMAEIVSIASRMESGM